jgi:hypothetical protein
MAVFQIDEGKLRRALPAPTSSRWEDLKWSSAFFALVGGLIAWLLYLGWLLLRALF